MKKFFLISIIFILLTNIVAANDNNKYVNCLKTKHNEFKIKNVIYKQARYAHKKQLANLLNLLSEEYSNCDNYNKSMYKELLVDVWKAYPNMTYKANIKSIKLKNNNFAELTVEEFSEAKLSKNIDLSGILSSQVDVIYYLRKENNKWKIVYEEIINESTTISYGTMNYINVDLSAPKGVSPKENYSAVLRVDKIPSETIIVASIAKETIEYPQRIAKEVFRKLPEDGILERLFIANDEGKNEYIMTSVALTQADIVDEKFKIFLTGYGYKIVRVNMINKKEGFNDTKI